MNQDLALALLGEVMDWDLERSRTEFAWLQLMSRFKYDGYSDFVAGVRFIESMAGWLQQFDPPQRSSAYSFIKTYLIYFSPSEIQHLVDLVYANRVRVLLLREVASELKKPSYLVWSDTAAYELYRKRLRQSLFFGLSDGARIDTFRRATAGIISNEQILLATEIASGKWDQVLADLREALKDEQVRFRHVFLIDDFIATGTTLKGKLKRFWRDCQAIVQSHFDDQWIVFVHHYIATKSVTEKIGEQESELRRESENGWFRKVEFSFELVLPVETKVDETKAGPFWSVIQEYYNSGVETRHTRKGGGKDVKLGFGQCALPLVLEHNTPNNSLPILWADIPGTDKEPPMRPLFRRRQRHSELA